jgi:HAMP domain-containing protein
MKTVRQEQGQTRPFARRTASQPSVHWWLRLTSSGWNLPQTTFDEREHKRRSQMTSWIILGLLLADGALLWVNSHNLGDFSALLLIGVGLLSVTFLNRLGFVTWAGILIIFLICGGVLGSLMFQPGKSALDVLPSYDLLTVAVIVAASVLPRPSIFVVAAMNIGLICLDFLLESQAVDVQRALQAYPSITAGMLALLARPLALQLVVATVAYFWARGTHAALVRADQMEELIALEHTMAAQRRQLESGVQDILEALVRVANGQLSTRIPVNQDYLLWQITSALNNLLNRLQRASMAEHEFHRTQEEISRLAQAIEDAQSGLAPLWPAPAGTPVDLLIDRITGIRYRGDSSVSLTQLPVPTEPSAPKRRLLTR